MATVNGWIKLTNPPFQSECGRTSVLLNDNVIICSPVYDDCFTFHINTEKWIKHELLNNLEDHAVCLSMDKTKLYLYEGFDQMLTIIDTKTMKISKVIDDLFRAGTYPVIISDPQNINLLHIIGVGSHIAVNINTNKSSTIHSFREMVGDPGLGIVYVKRINSWIYFGGRMLTHIYDLNGKKWRAIHAAMPGKWKGFGYILSNDEKYIVIFGGYKAAQNYYRTMVGSDGIVVFDIDEMKYIESKMKCPTVYNRSVSAVLTNNDDIHLFIKEQHWKMSINTIIKPIPELIFGYVKHCNMDLPNDIIFEIVKFHGPMIV